MRTADYRRSAAAQQSMACRGVQVRVARPACAAAAAARAQQQAAVLVPAALAVALAMGFATPAWAGAPVIAPPAGNAIVPDGRTQTVVSQVGRNVTDIATRTISAGIGYNSFSRFVVGQGNDVNMLLPGGTSRLVNIVTGGPVDIEGVLRSFKDGALGGNVVFADSQGLIVGRSGVVDVGGFTVVTPTSSVLGRLIDASGKVDDALSRRLLAGNVPLSSDGSVVIDGKVLAQHGVAIFAHDVLVGATPSGGQAAAQQAALFQSTVNTSGLVQGAAIVARGGNIQIVAAHDATVDGTLSADASKGGAGSVSISAGHDVHVGAHISTDGAPATGAGSISIRSGGDIDVAATAVLSAAGAGAGSDGGHISIKAGRNLDVADGATLQAQAGSTGNAGEIELSAKDKATLGRLNLDLGAAHGQAGLLLVDPTDLIVDNTNDSAYTTGGGSVQLMASNSITIDGTGVINTEAPGGASGGNIELDAPSISLLGGAQLLAGTGANAGTITLNAQATASSAAQIDIGDSSGSAAVLQGGKILLEATSDVAQSYDHATITIQDAKLMASGALSASATATGGTQVNAVAAAGSADVLASVKIIGASNVTSAGAMILSSSATSTVGATGAIPASLSLPADASVAVDQVDSTSTVEIGGSSSVSTTGANHALELEATNDVTSNVVADASGASAGASVAVNIVKVQTSSTIDGSAKVASAGNLQLSGTTTVVMSTSAKASQGGASSAAGGGSSTSQYLSDPRFAPDLATSDGAVTGAAALAISDLGSATTVGMSSTTQATAAGQLQLQSQAANGASSIADGSAVGSSSGQLGIGAAVALNLDHVSDDATLAQDVKAASLDVSAQMTGGIAANRFLTSATAGAGASDVGVAGALATNLVDSESVAQVASGSVQIAGGGAVDVGSDDLTSSSVSALPAGTGASGGSVGVGASVALNIVATRSQAQLADGTSLTGAGAVTLEADGTHVVSTQADQGAAGGVAVTPVVALSLVNDQTQATIGALAGGLQAGGAVQVSASQTATEATEASGSAAGGKAAVGAALAVSVIDDSVLATTSTSVDAGGAVDFAASGVSLSVASATASASGGNQATSSGSAPSGEDSSVDAKIQKQSNSAETKASSADVGSASQQSADSTSSGGENGQGSTSEGSVAVAAAIAVDVANSTVQAYVPAAVGVTASGGLGVTAVSNMDARTIADGSQVAGGGTSVGIGAAVAITLAHQVNDATLGSSTALSSAPTTGTLTAGDYQAGSLTLTALQTDQGVASPAVPGSTSPGPASVDATLGTQSGREDLYSAQATSGAGASKVGLAGSLAVNVIHSDSSATVTGAADVTIGGGAVNLGAADLMSADATASPTGKGASGGKLGVGASVALNTITENSQASIDDGATLNGTLGSLNVAANSLTDTSSTAQAGAAGGVAVDAVVAMSILDETTQASVGSGDSFTTSGDVGIEAASSGTNTASADASVDGSGSSVAIGGSVAVITGPGILGATGGGSAITSQTTASMNRDAVIGGNLQITASSDRTYDAESTASASGNQFSSAMQNGNDSTAGGGSVASGDTLNTSQAQGAMSQSSSDSSQTQSKASGSSSSQGKVSVAAAVGAVIAGDQVSAGIGGGTSTAQRSVSTGGTLQVTATNQGDVFTQGDGSTDTSSKVGIGVGVALSVVDNATSANIGSYTTLHAPAAVSVHATSTENQDAGFTDGRVAAVAMSGASAGKVAVAGAIAVAVSTSSTTAGVGDYVSISGASGGAAGALSVQADNTSSWGVNAWSGSKSNQGVGIGASIAAVISTDTYSATLGQHDSVDADGVTVSATNEKVDNPLSAVSTLAGDVSSDASSDSSSFGGNVQSDAAAVQSQLKTLAGTALQDALLGQNNYLAEVGAGAASGGSAAISGGFAVEVIDNQVTASVGSDTTIHSGGGVSVQAQDDTASKTLVGSLAASSGSAGVGVDGAFLYDDSSIQASLDSGVTIASSTSVKVDAGSTQSVDLFELSAGAADEAGVAGVIGVITSQRNATATIGDGSSITSSGGVGVSAGNDVSDLNIGGSIGVGGSAGIGATLISTIIGGGASATVDSSQSTPTTIDAASLDVNAGTSENLVNVAVAGSAAGDVAISGAATPLVEQIATSAGIGPYSSVHTSGAVQVEATDQSQVVNVGGAVGGAGSVGVGLTGAASDFTNSIGAAIGSNSTVDAGSVDVQAGGSVLADNIVVAGAVGGDVGASGVLSPVTEQESVTASIGPDSRITTSDAASGFVDVLANASTQVFNIGGAVGGGAVGVGGSAAATVLTDTTRASIGDGSSVKAVGAVEVAADDTENVSTAVVSGAAGGVGVAVALASSDIVDTTEAYIGYGATVDANSVDVGASDQTTIDDIAGSAAGGGTGVSAGADVVVLVKHTHAWIGEESPGGSGAATTVDATGGDVTVTASSTESVTSTVAGAAIGGDAGAAGAVQTYVLTGDTQAGIGSGDTVSAYGNVGVLASDADNLNALVGGGALGGAAGIGASIGVSVVQQTTLAGIGSDAVVSALGQGDAQNLTSGFSAEFSNHQSDINATSASEAGSEGSNLTLYTRTASPVTRGVHGVLVNATASGAIDAIAVSGAVGGAVGAAISGSVPVVISDTEASIGSGATVNGSGSPAAAQSVAVAAASDLYVRGITGALGGGGAVGIGAGLLTNVIDNTTKAFIDSGATVSAASNVDVTANASEDFGGVAASAGLGGTVGVAGGATVLALDDTTYATIDGSVDAGGSVVVAADDQTRVALTAGSLAVGITGAGVGAGIGVAVLIKDTEATVGQSAVVNAGGNGSDAAFGLYTSGTSSATTPGQGLLVSADSGQSIDSIALAGAGGAFAGVAGAVGVQAVLTTTLASIDGGAQIDTGSVGASSNQNVDVVARDSTAMADSAGAAGVGFAGVGGAVNVAVLTSDTAASIGDNATVDPLGDVSVAAYANKAISSNVEGVAGGVVGLGASINVLAIANGTDASKAKGSDSETIGALTSTSGGQSTGGNADSAMHNNSIGSQYLSSSSNSSVTSASTSAQNAQDNASASAVLDGNGASGTSASIGNASVHAGGSISVDSQDTVSVAANSGAAAFGVVGIGAGVGVAVDTADNTASIAGTSTLSGSSISVDATTTHGIGETSVAGSVGLLAGADAVVAYSSDTSQTSAYVQGSTLQAGGGIGVKAKATRNLQSTGAGAALAGSVAAGASVAIANVGGSVQAYADKATFGTLASPAGEVDIGATSYDSAQTQSAALSAGIGIALDGSVATSTVSPGVATYFDGGNIVGVSAVNIDSEADDAASANATGGSIAIVGSAGASVATATAAPDVTADISASSIQAASLALHAEVGQSGSVPSGVTATASGMSGAAFVGANASSASANNNAQAIASAENSGLDVSGAIDVQGLLNSEQNASSTGVAIGGLLALGADLASAGSDTTTRATLNDMGTVHAGQLTLNADATDGNFANATAGSGGAIAGAAALATTSSQGQTVASIGNDTAHPVIPGNYDVQNGAVSITATHAANFGGWVDSTNAAVVGASGAELNNTVDSVVSAALGPSIQVLATDFTLDAKNYATRLFRNEGSYDPAYNPDLGGWDVNSGSGGLINAPAASSSTDVTLATTATVGDGSSVHLLPPLSAGQVSTLFIEAYNDAVVQQRVQMNSGGAVALAAVSDNIDVNDTATVSIGNQSTLLVDIGDVEIGAWGNANLYAIGVATTYGAAGAPTGSAHVDYTGTDLVSVGTNAEVQATDGIDPLDGSAPSNGTVTIAAGDSPTDVQQTLSAYSEIDLYNNTVIPIPIPPDPQSNITSNALVVIAADPNQVVSSTDPSLDTHYGINAAGNIYLSADQGAMSTTANGTGTNIYLQTLSKAASAVSEFFGGGAVTFKITGGSTSQSGSSAILAAGLVDTGIQRDKYLTIGYAGTIQQAGGTCDPTQSACLDAPTPGAIGYTTTQIAPGGDMVARLAKLQQLKAEYASDPIAQGAYDNEISFMETELASLGMGKFVNGTFQLNSDVQEPQSVAQQNLPVDEASLSAGIANLQLATSSLSGADGLYATAIASTVNDPQHGIIALANSALTTISQFGNYASYTGVPQGQTSSTGSVQLAGVNTQESNLKNEVSAFQADAGSDSTAQKDIATQVADIFAAQTALDGSTGGTANASNAAFASALGTAQTQINADLTTINGNVGDEQSQASALTGSANALYQDLSGLAIGSAASADSHSYAILISYTAPTGNSVATGGKLGLLGQAALPALGTEVTSVNANYNAEQASYKTLTAAATQEGSIGQFVSLLTNDATTVATDLASASGVASVQQINVDPTVARLGNIDANAQVLTSSALALNPTLQALIPAGLSLGANQGEGEGELQAPGDASITITNNTADPLSLNGLTIPDYIAGYVLFNGAQVNSAQDISAINAGGAQSYFGSVVTRADSATPAITIQSNYNPNDNTFYAPSTPPNPLFYLRTQFVAPDITNNGAITNYNGSVVIDSSAGNIYQDGTIDAQSVSITAHDGDYSANYVNSISSVAGDPSAQSPATSDATCPNGIAPPCASEAGLGQGIIANGNVSIAARYLNINGLIQSGIVDNTLTIAPTDLLTTTNLASIGATQYQGTSDHYAQNPTAGALITLSTDARGNSLYVNPNNGAIEFGTAYAGDYYASTGGSASNDSYELVSPNSNISATYDAAHQRYTVDATEVHGGYIQLYGQILDTSPNAGQLKVLDGFGSISIDNQTTDPVVLSTLNTGPDPSGTGRGTAGVIDITDVHLDSANSQQVDVTHTVYTYDPAALSGQGGVIETYQSGTLNPDGTGNYGALHTDSALAGRSDSYNPMAGQRYVFATASDNNITTSFTTTSTDLLGLSSLQVASYSNVNDVNTTTGSSTLLPNGTYISSDSTATSSDSLVYDGTHGIIIASTPTVTTLPNSQLENDGSRSTTTDYLTQSKLSQTGSSTSCVWWTACIASDTTNTYSLSQDYTQIVTTSLKADYAIGISFTGSSTGSIQVESAGNVVLTGAIGNANGSTSISAGMGSGNPNSSIVQGASTALVRSAGIQLDASGSIGGVTDAAAGAPVDAPVAVQLSGGALSAVAGGNGGSGNLSISSSGNLVIGSVSADVPGAQSSVSLSSDLDIVGAAANSLVQGDYVSLVAPNGQITGAGGGALAVDSGFTTDQALRPFGPTQTPTPYYGLRAQAAGNIDISAGRWADDSAGNLLLDTVVSSGGDVTLSAPGQMLDNNPVQTVDERTQQNLLSFWQSLGLTAGSENTLRQNQTIAAYDASVTQQYDQYWAIRDSQPDGGAVYDPNFQVKLSEQQLEVLAAQKQTPQEIAALQASQTQQYHTLNSEVGGLTASYVAGYQYQATAAQRASLTQGATWSTDTLSFALSAALLKTVTNTNDVVKAPNVSGRTVTLDAGTGVGETIQSGDGTNNSFGTLIAAGTRPSAMTQSQQLQLASAEASDLLLTVHYAGGTVQVPLGTPYAKLTATQQAALDAAASGQAYTAGSYLTILTKRPLNVAPSVSLNLAVSTAPDATLDVGDAYVASLGSVALGSISVPGEARIKVDGSLTNAATSDIRTGNIILEAADGTIGALAGNATATDLALSLLPGASITARAENGVYISTPGADALVDTIYSPGTVSLLAGGSILDVNQNQSLNLLADQVLLDAQSGSIGTPSYLLNVGVTTPSGGIIADAATPGQSVWLYGPSGYDFVIDGVDSGGAVELQAAGDSTIAGSVDALSQVSLSAGGRQVITGGGDVSVAAGNVLLGADSLKMLDGARIDAASGDVAIDTTGDALVTGVSSESSDANAVSVVAGGHILAGTAPGRTDISATTAGAGVSLDAGLGIGDETEADTEATDATGQPTGSANQITGVPNPLIIRTGHIALSSTTGNIDVTTSAAVASGTISAPDGSVDVSALQDLSLSSITAPLGGVTVQSAGALDLGDVASGGTQNLQSVGNLDAGSLVTTGLPGDPGNIDLLSSAGGIDVGNADSPNGSIRADAFGAVSFGALASKGPLSISSQTAIDLPAIAIGSGSAFGAPVIRIASITPSPGTAAPFELDLGGANGGVGLYASVAIDTTMPVVIGSLRETDAYISSLSPVFAIDSGYILHNMLLVLPDETINLSGVSPRPVDPKVVGLFDPGYVFRLTQIGYHTSSNAFFVNDTHTSEIAYLLGGGALLNQNFVEDFVRAALNGDTDPLEPYRRSGMETWVVPLRAPVDYGMRYGIEWPQQPAVGTGHGKLGLSRRDGKLHVSRL